MMVMIRVMILLLFVEGDRTVSFMGVGIRIRGTVGVRTRTQARIYTYIVWVGNSGIHVMCINLMGSLEGPISDSCSAQFRKQH